MIESLWTSFKAKWPPNRVAVLLCATVLPILTIAGGDVAAWSARHFPSLHLTGAGVTAAFVAGMAAVALPGVTAAYKWFSGWIQHENKLITYHEGLVEPSELPKGIPAIPTVDGPAVSAQSYAGGSK